MNPTNIPTRSDTAGLADRLGEPGVTLYVRHVDGPPVQAETGAANLELATPVGKDTTFNVGSVAKQITAYLCIRAARDRLLTLDRPVGDILPRFHIPDVTVGDLIQHRGGIRDAESLLSLAGFRELDHYTANDLLQLAYRQQRRAVEPGRFLYSNTGYLLLAEVLTHVYGAGLRQIADLQVFAPLGMTSARFKNDPREVIPGAAASYQAVADGWQHQQRPATLPGPGSLWCTAADLDRWLAHLRHEWHASANDALPFEQDIGYWPSDQPPFTYGAGLYADPRPSRTAVFHYGHEQGFSAATYLTTSGLRVICLSNHAGIAAGHVAAVALADITDGISTEPGKLLSLAMAGVPSFNSTSVSEADIDAHQTEIGIYVCDEVPGTVRLTHSSGSLCLWRRGASDRLTRIDSATYAADGYTLTLPTASTDGMARTPAGFILDLDRAPRLQYQRRPD
ncbi:serine hydrolase domain-containing protein [Micromonospora sp. NPDC047793]|uniref:serine hydrolase domain-containing protein n=1 Tax=Micromonospora sp. NPDC047793 TaxID=3154342 RepID=UPI0033CB462C